MTFGEWHPTSKAYRFKRAAKKQPAPCRECHTAGGWLVDWHLIDLGRRAQEVTRPRPPGRRRAAGGLIGAAAIRERWGLGVSAPLVAPWPAAHRAQVAALREKIAAAEAAL